ncbi:MAG: HIT family protein [Planctomycetota bacterium]
MTTFADIVSGSKPVHVVYCDDLHVAWLAERPARRGHLILATKRVVDSVFDLPPMEHAALWAAAHTLGRHLRERLPCQRVCVSVIGWLVRHAHVHLVPTDAPGQVPGLDGEPLAAADMAALQQALSVRGSRDARS